MVRPYLLALTAADIPSSGRKGSRTRVPRWPNGYGRDQSCNRGSLSSSSTGDRAKVLCSPPKATALNNLKAVLELSGSSVDKIVKVNVWLQDMGDFAAMNEVYIDVSHLTMGVG